MEMKTFQRGKFMCTAKSRAEQGYLSIAYSKHCFSWKSSLHTAVFIYIINDSEGGRAVPGRGQVLPPSPESAKEIAETFA